MPASRSDAKKILAPSGETETSSSFQSPNVTCSFTEGSAGSTRKIFAKEPEVEE